MCALITRRSQGAAVCQPQRSTGGYPRSLTDANHTTDRDDKEIMERSPIFRCRRKPEYPEETYQDGYGIGKPNSRTTTG